MTKAILFDLDGLVITKKDRLFSQRVSEEMSLPYDQVSAFFTGEFRECSFGKADLKEKIAPHLTKWGYAGSVDNFLEYWFQSESDTDKEVLAIVTNLRSKGIKCFIATRQEKYRKQYLLDVVGLKSIFDGIYCTCDIGYDKWESGYWDFVFNDLKVKPEDIIFFCDSQKNIDNASKFGIPAFFYTNIEVLRKNTDNLPPIA